MSDRGWVVIGAVLALGGLVTSAIVTRPRSLREVAYLALPLVGAVVLLVLSWQRA